jgi:aminopeptidase N/puromycin-sensitive aminopeptidase
LRLRHFAVLATSFLTTFSCLSAQRLPDVAQPQHYSLQLVPDLQAATFTGEETIELNLSQASNSLVLNALELKFQHVSAESGGRSYPATVTLDAQKQQATFQFEQMLPAGFVRLKIAYSGVLNGSLRGFYLSKSATRNYAVTQFESTDARRAFPSFDEPALKATFDVSLVVPLGDTAISNTNMVSDTPGPGPRQHTIRFARTPKMSTYLVAFLVGDFQCLSGESDGVPIRACATPDKVQLGQFALSGAEFFLHYYDTYFGIKYPMPKLDMIAIPDFEAGAMENFGAITYRETAMLVDEKTASLESKKNVAIDVAHEMAHQWFGDMVTTQWWDNIWLNEGFATWMSYKPLTAWKPEWDMPQEQASELNKTLDLDGRKVTRTIRAKADTPDEINEMFDGISYGKAAAVLLMTENYLGEETFRQGVHNYLQAHMYGNATAEDFWNMMQSTSGKPADKVIESLVVQPGEPLLTFGRVEGEKVKVSQRRFFLNPGTKQNTEQTWVLPVCMKDGGGQADCSVLSGREQQFAVPQSAVFYANAGGKGYYRSRYDQAQYKHLVENLENGLTPAERITFVGSQWALAHAAIDTVGDFLDLASAVHADSSPFVIETVTNAIGVIDQQIASTPEEHKRLAAWVRKTFAPALLSLGDPAPSDGPDKNLLRANLFELVGDIGADPRVIAQARQIAERSFHDPGSVDATFASRALKIAAENGDAQFFSQVKQVYETSPDPQIRHDALRALSRFRDPALVRRALEYFTSPRVKNQDALRSVQIEMSDRRTRDIAWEYVQKNWTRVQAQITTSSGGDLVSSTGNFCSEEQSRAVAQFFSEHPVAATAHTLDQARDRISDCVDLRAAQGASLQKWLAAR